MKKHCSLISNIGNEQNKHNSKKFSTEKNKIKFIYSQKIFIH